MICGIRAVYFCGYSVCPNVLGGNFSIRNKKQQKNKQSVCVMVISSSVFKDVMNAPRARERRNGFAICVLHVLWKNFLVPFGTRDTGEKRLPFILSCIPFRLKCEMHCIMYNCPAVSQAKKSFSNFVHFHITHLRMNMWIMFRLLKNVLKTFVRYVWKQRCCQNQALTLQK